LPKIIEFLEDKNIFLWNIFKRVFIKENLIRKLKKSGLREIQISLDSMNSKTWAKMTGMSVSDFKKVIETMLS
jgi:molybdenum cofactor biosynthesis enzyme MoaA